MKNRWLFRHSCRSLVEDLLEWMLEKYFKKNDEWVTRKEDLEHWKTAMRFVAAKHMDLVLTEAEFIKKFNNYLTHHNLRRAILYGKELNK